jgi:uncharacterized protein
VIAYFDTSAVLPLIIDEPGSAACNQVFNEASRVVSVRLLYVEARAALARARRMARLTRIQREVAVADLDAIIVEIDHVEVTAGLVRTAGALAESHDLRGYDAVHLAAALAIADHDTVLVSGDNDLANAAADLGLAVARTS